MNTELKFEGTLLRDAFSCLFDELLLTSNLSLSVQIALPKLSSKKKQLHDQLPCLILEKPSGLLYSAKLSDVPLVRLYLMMPINSIQILK